jgi:hypothetical protein
MSKQHIRDAFGRLVPTYLLDEATSTKKGKSDVEIHLPSEKPNIEELSRTDMRTVAKLYYVTDLQECTVEEMAALPQFSGVALSTLRAWCTQDGWVDTRKQVKEDWRKKLEEKLGEEITRQRLVFLDEMQGVWRQGMKMLDFDRIRDPENDDPTPIAMPKTWEGVASAMVKLGDMMDRMRVAIRDDVAPKNDPAARGGSKMKVEVDLSDDEAVGAVKAILERRRAKVRLQAGISDEDIIEPPEKK